MSFAPPPPSSSKAHAHPPVSPATDRDMAAEASADARGFLKVRVLPSPTRSPTRHSVRRRRKAERATLPPESDILSLEKTEKRVLTTPTQFDASFEGGNLGSAKQITENEYELTIRPDTNAARYRLWFHFRVSNARPGQKVLFHVTNFSKSKSLYKDGMSPVFRSGASGHRTWERVHPKNVFYYRTKDSLSSAPSLRGRGSSSSIERSSSGGSAGNDDESEKGTLSDGDESASERRRPRKPHILSFTHVFGKDARVLCADDDAVDGDESRPKPDEDAFVEFAYSYPFAFAEQQSWLDALEARNLPHVHRRTLAHSLQGRKCDVIVIDGGVDPDAPPGTALAPRRVVFLSCRVHPGETPASHALFGFLDFVVSSAPAAAALRRKVTFVVVPMLNPDGCAAGNYRADSNGADLNRRWADCSATREPTLHAAKALIRWYARDPCHALDFFVDVHAHTSSKASFMYVEPPRFASDDEESGGEEDGDAVRVDARDALASARRGASEKETRDETTRVFRLKKKREKAFAWERAAALPRLLELNAGAALGFALNHCRFCENPEKAGAGRRAVSSMLASEARERELSHKKVATARDRTIRETDVPSKPSDPSASVQPQPSSARVAPVSLGLLRGAGAGMCYTLEMSFYGVAPKSPSFGGSARAPWSPWGSNDETYRRFGIGLAHAFLDYYGLRRDAEAEAVTARVFHAAATGEHAHPERAFGNQHIAEPPRSTELFAVCVAPALDKSPEDVSDAATSAARAARDAQPWLRGASLAKAEKSPRASRASKSERAARRAAAAAAAAKEKARPKSSSSSRREPRVLASSVSVVGSDLDGCGTRDRDPARVPAGDDSAASSAFRKMVGGVVPPARRARRSAAKRADDGASATATVARNAAAASPRRGVGSGSGGSGSANANEKEKEKETGGGGVANGNVPTETEPEPNVVARVPRRVLAGGQFRHTSELLRRGSSGTAKRSSASARAKRETLLGSFRVPNPARAFGKASEGKPAAKKGDGGDAFGVTAELARAKLSE